MKQFALAVLCAAAVGCGGSVDSAENESPSDPTVEDPHSVPLSAEDIAKLNVPPGLQVTSAFTTTQTKRSPGVKQLNTTVGGSGGNLNQAYWDTSYWGMFGRAASLVDQLGFKGDHGNTPGFGGSGGYSQPDMDCSSGQRVLGIFGRAGAVIDAIGPVCGVPGGTPTANQQMGGTGGNPFPNYVCPPQAGWPTWVIGWQVRSGSLVDAISVYCGRS